MSLLQLRGRKLEKDEPVAVEQVEQQRERGVDIFPIADANEDGRVDLEEAVSFLGLGNRSKEELVALLQTNAVSFLGLGNRSKEELV